MGDVGIAPYAKFKDYAKFETLHEKLLQEFKNASGAALDNDRMLLT